MQTFPTPGKVSIRVQIAAGTIYVHAHDAAETTVELEPVVAGDESALAAIAATRIEARDVGDGHEITVEAPERRAGRTVELRLVIRTPAGAELDVRTLSADVVADGLGRTTARVASGSVQLGDISGDVRVESASGDVVIGVVDGRLRVRTASGGVDVRTAVAGIGVSTASGAVHVGRVDGDVEIATASGAVRLDDVGAGSGSVRTASGGVEIGVRRGTVVDVDAKTLSGRADSEVPLDGVAAAGAPTLRLRVATLSGDIRVTRAADAVAP
jgi:DUF4097 and DUF4098 domain-containing protein YvlB